MTVYLKNIKNKMKMNWRKAIQFPVKDYSIEESGYHEKTATITSTQHIDLTSGTIAILITHPYHENFAGIIRSEDYKPKSEEYTYKCDDFHVFFNDKISRVYKKATGRSILQDALTYGKLKQKSKFANGRFQNKWIKRFPHQLNGLKSNSRYEMREYGYPKKFNPMSKVYKNQKIENKTCWEIIKAYTVGTGAYIDLKLNDYGTMMIDSFDIKNFRRSVCTINEVYDDLKFKSSTDGLLTNVVVDGKRTFSSRDLTGGKYDLNDVFIQSVDTVTSNSTTKKTKTPSTNKSGNPYGTKNKEIWINMDLRSNYSSDGAWLSKVCTELRKLGWKVHNQGVGPNIHSDTSKMKQAKNGIFLTIDNGQCIDTIMDLCCSSWFTANAARNKVQIALFFVGISKKKSMLKGGRYYNSLGTAYDGTGAWGRRNYPASWLAYSGVPFGYCWNDSPKSVADKINSGGDSNVALQKDFFKIAHNDKAPAGIKWGDY